MSPIEQREHYSIWMMAIPDRSQSVEVKQYWL
jgi:hypothetical protein